MQILKIITVAGLAVGVAACATNAPAPSNDEQLRLTEGATKLVKREGAASAAERGTSETTDLVCETRKKTGSHMTERVCYTRVEGDEIRRESQETMRRTQRGDTRADETAEFGGRD